MKKRIVTWLFCLLMTALSTLQGVAAGENSATPDEVFHKLIEAVSVIQSLGSEGEEAWIGAFNNPDSEFVWKDTYVWVIDAGKKTNVAHPINQKIVGVDLSDIQCKKTGAYFFRDFLKAADNPNGIWTEYWWPKPDDPETLYRKITCVIPVAGTPYLVAAGIYDEDIPLEKLNRMLQ